MDDPLQTSVSATLPVPTRPILVIGATGAIGSQVVRALLARPSASSSARPGRSQRCPRTSSAP